MPKFRAPPRSAFVRAAIDEDPYLIAASLAEPWMDGNEDAESLLNDIATFLAIHNVQYREGRFEVARMLRAKVLAYIGLMDQIAQPGKDRLEAWKKEVQARLAC